MKTSEVKGKKLMVFLLLLGLLFFPGCKKTGTNAKVEKLSISMQHGFSYIPLKIVQMLGLIEKRCPNVEVEWKILNSGAVINEGLASGTLQFGAMGIGPAVTAVASGVPAKICCGLSTQPHKIMTNNSNIKSLEDIGQEDKIALVNIGSFQHVLLAMGAKSEMGDAHYFDKNIVAMSHPDGMAALLSGVVTCQLTTSPYIYKESDKPDIYEVYGLESVWPKENSFIVVLCQTDFQKNNREIYDAVCAAIEEADSWIYANSDKAAESLCAEYDVDAETMKEWLLAEGSEYSTICKGIMDYARFMAENGFIEKKVPSSFTEMAFDNVKGD